MKRVLNQYRIRPMRPWEFRHPFVCALAAVLTLFVLSSTVQAATVSSSMPVVGQEGEVDQESDACTDVAVLSAGGLTQPYTLSYNQDADQTWSKFSVQEGSRYLLLVQSEVGVQAALYSRCDADTESVALYKGQLEFTAAQDGDYYLLVRRNGDVHAEAAGYEVTLSPAAPHRQSSIGVAEVPQAVQRRATEFLEELRGADLAPEWQDARINGEARILYRPDMQEPAYYEVTVERPVGDGWEPAGYIQLSAGEHDYPIVNWNMTGLSSTQELTELAPLGATLTEIYRLNAMSYAAEYEEFTPIGIATAATDVISLGYLPENVEGLAAIPDEPFELVTQSIDSEGDEEYEGPTELPLLEEEPWESWAALKQGYEDAYGPLLASLEERASDRWELDKNLSRYGETLITGDIRTVYGLAAQTLSSIQVAGDGAAAQYLQQEQLSDGDTPTGVKLTVLDEPADPESLLPFEVTLQYTTGATETIKYAIANKEALNLSEPVYLPLISAADGNQSFLEAAESSQAAGSWGPWHFYWVDSHSDALALRYNQFYRDSCISGCGATGWAMNFAWVDRRAAESHWRWRDHWGIYRVAGGLGANGVAATNQDAGVNNMTWEIRNHLRTDCGGGTSRSNEINACEYVRPRATAAWRCRTRYDPTGLCWFGACNGARDLIRDQIVNRRAPAVLGAYHHIQMAVGYAYQSKRSCFLWICSTSYNRWFYVNKGWGGAENGWLDWDDVYLGGIYYPW